MFNLCLSNQYCIFFTNFTAANTDALLLFHYYFVQPFLFCISIYIITGGPVLQYYYNSSLYLFTPTSLQCQQLHRDLMRRKPRPPQRAAVEEEEEGHIPSFFGVVDTDFDDMDSSTVFSFEEVWDFIDAIVTRGCGRGKGDKSATFASDLMLIKAAVDDTTLLRWGIGLTAGGRPEVLAGKDGRKQGMSWRQTKHNPWTTLGGAAAAIEAKISDLRLNSADDHLSQGAMEGQLPFTQVIKNIVQAMQVGPPHHHSQPLVLARVALTRLVIIYYFII